MKRLALISMTLAVLFAQRSHAQYYSVNVDVKTVAAMTAAYGTGAAAEEYYDEQVQDILKNYRLSEAAAAGIFADKFLERRAKTDLGLWSSSTENYYYRRIYNMVAHKIIPKIWIDAKLMLHYHQNALYWGSYLMKVCDDTKSLCMQFESVVTNSTLSFSDIAFLEFRKEIASVLRLSELGDVDWRQILDDFAGASGSLSKESLKSDMDNLYSMAASLVTSGISNIGDALLQRNSFSDLMNGKISAVTDIYDNYGTLFRQLENNAGQTILGIVGGEDNVAGLFTFGDYDLSSWISDYLTEKSGNYYTQRWYITRSDTGETVYERIFDSYSMDLASFEAQINALLAEFNDNEDSYTYYIYTDSKNYYQATDAGKIEGCETVTISVTCSDGTTLCQGTTQYKCSECGSSLSSHTKECSMKSSVISEDLDLSDLETMLAEAEDMVSSLQEQIDLLEKENESLIRQISEVSVEDAIPLREQYNANRTEIERLEEELSEWQEQLDEIRQAQNDAQDDNDTSTDDYYRIPAIMQDLEAAYDVSWQGSGTWSGYTYTRKGSIPNISGTVTFNATLSMTRKPKYFLGIKIHRAIVQITWELTAEYSETHVVDVMTLDPDMSDEQKTKQVNDRISEIAREYPDCSVTTGYARSVPADDGTDDTDGTYHLLWSSDRLEIAREVDTRLTRIYADLVSYEKMMHYRRSILDALLDVMPELDDDQGRRLTLVEECRQRWIHNARLENSGEDGL